MRVASRRKSMVSRAVVGPKSAAMGIALRWEKKFGDERDRELCQAVQ